MHAFAEAALKASQEVLLFWRHFCHSDLRTTSPGCARLRLTARKSLIHNGFACGFALTEGAESH